MIPACIRLLSTSNKNTSRAALWLGAAWDFFLLWCCSMGDLETIPILFFTGPLLAEAKEEEVYETETVNI